MVKNASQSKRKGFQAEAAAGAFLRGKGFRILERNYRSKTGEIDLIAEKGGQLHFVEVRFRADPKDCSPQETVTPAKLRRIRMTAACYLQQKGLYQKGAQIDVIAISPGKIHWIPEV